MTAVTPENSRKRKLPSPPSPYSPIGTHLYNGDEEYFELDDEYFDYPVLDPIEGKEYKLITGKRKKFKTNKDNSSVLFHMPAGYVINENEQLKYRGTKIKYLGTKGEINAFYNYKNGKIFFVLIDEKQEEIFKNMENLIYLGRQGEENVFYHNDQLYYLVIDKDQSEIFKNIDNPKYLGTVKKEKINVFYQNKQLYYLPVLVVDLYQQQKFKDIKNPAYLGTLDGNNFFIKMKKYFINQYLFLKNQLNLKN
jgi:hypothetical protein